MFRQQENVVASQIPAALAAAAAQGAGGLRLRVSGISMLPSLWPGDLLLVRRCESFDPLPGEIIPFERDGLLITHRVVCRGKGFLSTRGDRNRRHDLPVPDDRVLGRVISIERNGRPVDFAFTRGRRLGAWILRRSDLMARVLLRIHARNHY